MTKNIIPQSKEPSNPTPFSDAGCNQNSLPSDAAGACFSKKNLCPFSDKNLYCFETAALKCFQCDVFHKAISEANGGINIEP